MCVQGSVCVYVLQTTEKASDAARQSAKTQINFCVIGRQAYGEIMTAEDS